MVTGSRAVKAQALLCCWCMALAPAAAIGATTLKPSRRRATACTPWTCWASARAINLAAPEAVVEPAAGLIALAEAQQIHGVDAVARRSDGFRVVAPMAAAGTKAMQQHQGRPISGAGAAPVAAPRLKLKPALVAPVAAGHGGCRRNPLTIAKVWRGWIPGLASFGLIPGQRVIAACCCCAGWRGRRQPLSP